MLYLAEPLDDGRAAEYESFVIEQAFGKCIEASEAIIVKFSVKSKINKSNKIISEIKITTHHALKVYIKLIIIF